MNRGSDPGTAPSESSLDDSETPRPSAFAEQQDTRAALWRLLLAARRAARTLRADDVAWLKLTAAGGVAEGRPASGAVAAIRFHAGVWHVAEGPADDPLLDLYLPLCAVSAERPLVLAHLGQSLDGHIATASGDSSYVNGAGNLDHLHRLRALADAVVIGAGTVEADDPRLTTRRVDGPNPVRVVIDPDGRLPATHGLFNDRQASTLLICADDRSGPAMPGVETLRVRRDGRGLDLVAVAAALAARGLHGLFVEGGGRTVSAFLEAGLVDRLQIAIAPLVTGAGKPALSLPPRATMADCLRPASRVFVMGDDVLFDCDLRIAGNAATSAAALCRVR